MFHARQNEQRGRRNGVASCAVRLGARGSGFCRIAAKTLARTANPLAGKANPSAHFMCSHYPAWIAFVADVARILLSWDFQNRGCLRALPNSAPIRRPYARSQEMSRLRNAKLCDDFAGRTEQLISVVDSDQQRLVRLALTSRRLSLLMTRNRTVVPTFPRPGSCCPPDGKVRSRRLQKVQMLARRRVFASSTDRRRMQDNLLARRRDGGTIPQRRISTTSSTRRYPKANRRAG